MVTIETELEQTFGSTTLSGFWQTVDSLDWSSRENIKNKLLRELSPAQSSQYKKILDYICETLADEISREDVVKNIFDLKTTISNIIGEKSYSGFTAIKDSADIVYEKLKKDGAPDINDAFLFMFPDEDDYWSIY